MEYSEGFSTLLTPAAPWLRGPLDPQVPALGVLRARPRPQRLQQGLRLRRQSVRQRKIQRVGPNFGPTLRLC
jgi:hypothetical protein